MTQTLFWNNNEIRFGAVLAPRYLYMATEWVMAVNGVTVAQTGGFSMVEHAEGTFYDRMGQPHRISARVDASLATTVATATVVIDGLQVGTCDVPIQNLAEGGAATCVLFGSAFTALWTLWHVLA